jgi:hypothetical protein
MAAVERHSNSATQIYDVKTLENNETVCQCCAKLRLDLLQTSLELQSTRQIIRILQEELTSTRPMVDNNQGTLPDNGEQTTIKTSSWLQVSSNQHKKPRNMKKKISRSKKFTALNLCPT